jgi:hypothetical protein
VPSPCPSLRKQQDNLQGVDVPYTGRVEMLAAIRRWGMQRYLVAFAAGVGWLVLSGVPTDLIETPLFVRMTPPVWWNYPSWVAAAVLVWSPRGHLRRRPRPKPGRRLSRRKGLRRRIALGVRGGMPRVQQASGARAGRQRGPHLLRPRPACLGPAHPGAAALRPASAARRRELVPRRPSGGASAAGRESRVRATW